MASIIQFKRGKAASWAAQNILLLPGEAGYEIDTGKLKIGNGTDRWNDLVYVNQGTQVFNAKTHYDFPSVGSENIIYKAQSEKAIYQWNPDELKYELVSSSSGNSGILDIDIIYGGDADDWK